MIQNHSLFTRFVSQIFQTELSTFQPLTIAIGSKNWLILALTMSSLLSIVRRTTGQRTSSKVYIKTRCMRYLKSIKKNFADILFLVLVAVFLYTFFVIYMTPSRVAWYREMRDQIVIFYQELTSIGR